MSSITSKSHGVHATGPAVKTTEEHKEPKDITPFAACFCPFSQRVWVALEHLQIPYQYYEVDPYSDVKPRDLLEISPKGLVPALKLNAYDPPRALNESTVTLEYIQDLAPDKGNSLLPPKDQPYARGLVRLQCDHISRNIVPAFFRYLQAQEVEAQVTLGKAYLDSLEGLFSLFTRAEEENEPSALGLWKEGNQLSMADALAAPFLFRSTNALKHYRGFQLPMEGKAGAYFRRLFEYEAFKRTCSEGSTYIEFYERYASNRPGTSQLADAINKGGPLP